MSIFRDTVKSLGPDAKIEDLAAAWLENESLAIALKHDEDFECLARKLLRESFADGPDVLGAVALEAALGRAVKKAVLKAVEIDADDEREYLKDIA
jgi:hypothetical protein